MPGVIPEAAPAAQVRPGALDVAAAAFRQGNIVSSLYDRMTTPKQAFRPSEDYDPFDDIAGFEDYASRFMEVDSPEEAAFIKARITAERADRETLQQAGGWGLASVMAAGIVDPATIAAMALPVAAPAAWGSRASRIGMGVGWQVGLDTASEVAFHGLQETRTLTESAINVGAGAIITGAVGTLATRIPKNELDRVIANLGQEMAEDTGRGSTVGAMRVGANTTLDDETIAKGGRWVAKSLGKINPILQLFESPFVETRRLAQELVNVPFLLNKNIKKGIGTADSVESRAMRRITESRLKVQQSFDSLYGTYRERIGKDAMRSKEFGRAVSAALRRGDESEIAEVAQVAKVVRKILDEDKALLQELGALPKDLETIGAKSYFPRVYNHDAIRLNRADFEQRLYDWYAKDNQFADRAEILGAVNDTYDAIMGTVRGMADIGDSPGIAGSLKERLLTVPDEILEPYLVSDLEYVLNGYLRSVVPQMEMRRTFGSIDLKAEVDAIQQAYQVKAAAATSNKVKEELRLAAAEDIKRLMGLRDRVLGQVGPRGDDAVHLVRAARLLRSYNYVRMLGMQTLSSMADAGKLVTRYGLKNTGKYTAKFLTNIKANKLIRADAKRMQTALDWVMDTRGATLADIGDELPTSKAEQFANAGTQIFTRFSGMATWNSSLKALTASLEQDAILRAASGANLSAFKRGQLAQLGIGDDELRRIAQQVAKHGDNSEGLMRARTELWDDKEAARIVEDAVVKAADIMVTTRGAGDLPLFMDKELAKTLLQFKSFGMASVTRTLVPMMQGFAHRDLATVNGAALMLTLGGLSYYVRELAAGIEPDLSPGRVVAESLNWSGLLAYAPDLYDPLAGLFHAPRLSRYTDKRVSDTFLGPTVGTVDQLFRTAAGVTDLGVTAKDVHAVRKLAPGQNVFYLRRLVNALEGELAEFIGAEGATNMTFMERIAETREL